MLYWSTNFCQELWIKDLIPLELIYRQDIIEKKLSSVMIYIVCGRHYVFLQRHVFYHGLWLQIGLWIPLQKFWLVSFKLLCMDVRSKPVYCWSLSIFPYRTFGIYNTLFDFVFYETSYPYFFIMMSFLLMVPIPSQWKVIVLGWFAA